MIEDAPLHVRGYKFTITENDKDVARAYLYFIKNDLHKEPFGLLEDVFVEEQSRGQGYGSQLVNKVIEEAKKHGCYKIICTSRTSKPKVHELYKKLGFKEHGLEFRIDF